VDDLITHVRNSYSVNVKMAAYRQGRSDAKEWRILIFVEASESFAFLWNLNNWPTKLTENDFIVRKPSIPPQLAVVPPSVSHYVDWEEFGSDINENITGVANVIRFKNKQQES
jgi:hypothetical protein